MAGESVAGGSEVAAPRRLDLPLLARRPAGSSFVRLILDAPPDWDSLPGQFINALCESDPQAVMAAEGRVLDDAEGGEWPQTTGLELARRWPLVRRPLSISRVFRDAGRVRLDILVRAVGAGTQWLASRPVGATLNLVGPLGNHFTLPEGDRLCLLVGGGCGVAPIFGLADYLVALGRRCVAFLGAANVHKMPTTFRELPEPTHHAIALTDDVSEFAESETPTVLATDDGSAGYFGTASAAVEERAGGPVRLRADADDPGSGADRPRARPAVPGVARGVYGLRHRGVPLVRDEAARAGEREGVDLPPDLPRRPGRRRPRPYLGVR